MNIRHSICLLVLAMPLLHGCNGARVEELESQVAALEMQLQETQERLSDAETAAQELENAVDDLENAVAEFRFVSWREAVPSVLAATIEVRDRASAMTDTVSEAVDAAK